MSKTQNETIEQTYGYMCISNLKQVTDYKLYFKKKFDIEENHVYIDIQTDGHANRIGLYQLLSLLNSGDTLYLQEYKQLGDTREDQNNIVKRLSTMGVRLCIVKIPKSIHYKQKNHTTETYGFVRISDSSQKIDRQMDYMINQLGIDEDHIWVEKRTGKNFDRPVYKKMFKKLRAGDTLYIKELDRLGRNKVEIKDELTKLRNKKVKVRIINIPTTMHDFGEDDWILDMVNNILIEVLAAVAEQERITNHQRQAEGIAAARARGVKLGRPRVTFPENFEYYYTKYRSKEMQRAEILEALGVDGVKFQTYVRSWENMHKQE